MTSWLRQEARKFHAWNRPELEAFGLLVLAEVERRLKQQVGESGVGEPGVIVTPVTIVRSLREEST